MFGKNKSFQSLIVISISIDCCRSGLAQESVISLIGSFWGKLNIGF